MPFYSSSGSSYRPAKKCQMRHCDREVGYYESSSKNSFYCPRHSCHANYKCRTPSDDGERFCKTHAVCAHYGCGKRISEEDKSFRYSKGGTDSWLCSEHRCKADDCYKHRRDSNTKYCDDHAKDNKCEVSDCSSDRSSKHYCDKHTCQHPDCTRKTLNSGRSKEKCRHHQPNSVLTMANAGYIDVMVSSGRDLGIVLSTSATLQPAIDPKTYLMPLAPGSVIDTDVPLQVVQILSSTPRVIMSRDALNIPANDQAVVKKPVLTVQNLLSVFPTVA
ncbi:hypothetical protein FPSE_01650 [Fusarium pseudograminearum CS3096]|uniref:Uncharacterized protein n=1 Tax=Fusarium pseudograminearum (strain CS3096) TaxID=1028729 RepID=K3VSC6_FUSPC|nr:hypothetical protein FPSE_01650 [Fusarium pseudograminearum CS3096]EKJ78189.1 hypothetical protein FPSE_01650 [Fusarium pseudograminearum CS3096]